jgi:hypothetical protein
LVANAPPEVAIAAPEDGAILSGAVDVLVVASDDEAPEQVEFRWYLDGESVEPDSVTDGPDGSSEWAFAVDPGDHQMVVWGLDAGGLSDSDHVSFRVSTP